MRLISALALVGVVYLMMVLLETWHDPEYGSWGARVGMLLAIGCLALLATGED